MQNPTPPRPEEVGKMVVVCWKCGAENTDWSRFCAQCGQEIQSPEAAAQTELGHLGYVLHEVDRWSQQAVVSPEAAARLRWEYARRQESLRRNLMPDAATSQSAPVTPPPIPTLPGRTEVAEAWQQRRQPGAAMQVAAPPIEPDAPGALRIFLQEHALKIVFALAAILVLAALRSMLAWEWMDAILLRLIPLVPLTLTGMFAYFGQKTRQENPWAAFVYHALTAVLMGFDVVAANKYWLDGALALKPMLCTAFLASTATAGILLLRWREIPYLHLFQTGVLAALYMVLQMFRVGAASQDLRPAPLWLFGGVYLLLAAFCFLAAQRSRRAASPETTESEESVEPGVTASGGMWTLAWTFWAHLSAVSVALIAALDMAFQATVGGSEFAGLLCFAGLIYGVAAHLLRDARMVYLAGTLLVGGSIRYLILQQRVPVWTGFTGVLLALSALALVLAAFQRRLTAQDSACAALATAYGRLAQGGVGIATVLTGFLMLPLFYPTSGTVSANALTIALLAAVCGAYHLTFARSERQPGYIYAFLTCTAQASGLLAWRLLPFPTNLADCLAPFALTTAAAALWYVRVSSVGYRVSEEPTNEEGERRKAKSESTISDSQDPIAEDPIRHPTPDTRHPVWDTRHPISWLDPLSLSALAAIALGLVAGIGTLLEGFAGAQMQFSLWPILIAAGLVTAARRKRGADTLRTAGVGALCVGVALDVAMFCGLHDGIGKATATQWLAWAGGLTALGWLWWLLAQTLPRLKETDVWSEEFTLGGLATALLAALVAAGAVFFNPVSSLALLGWGNACLIGVFALFALHIYRYRQEAALMLSLLMPLLACGIDLQNLPVAAPFGMSAFTLGMLLAAGVYLLLARRLEKPQAAYLSCLPLACGLVFTFGRYRAHNLPVSDREITDALWCVGGALFTWAYAETARWSRRSEFVCAAAVALAASYLHTIRVTLHPAEVGYGLILLPLFVGMYLASRRFTGEAAALFGSPLRRTAVTLSTLALFWATVQGDALLDPNGLRQTGIVTLTLAVYGLVAAFLALLHGTPRAVAACAVTLTTAYLHYLLTQTPLLDAVEPLSWPRVAFFSVQAALFWIGVGWYAQKARSRADLAAPLKTLAGGIALASALLGVLTVTTPNEGRWTILTLAWAGAVWFGMWLLGEGEGCLHVGVWNLLAGWMLLVHDQVHGDLGCWTSICCRSVSICSSSVTRRAVGRDWNRRTPSGGQGFCC
jgi:hypothetical protein